MMKPLFIPLKTEFFEAFENGTKDTEYRVYGPRWNEKTCALGRDVVLSHGYGTKRRLRGVVVGFDVSITPTWTDAWRKCYGDESKARAACIRILLVPNASNEGPALATVPLD
jgi:hypothetical protein